MVGVSLFTVSYKATDWPQSRYLEVTRVTQNSNDIAPSYADSIFKI